MDEQYILLGESFSGPIAIALAAKGLRGLRTVVLVCTFARLRPRAGRCGASDCESC